MSVERNGDKGKEEKEPSKPENRIGGGGGSDIRLAESPASVSRGSFEPKYHDLFALGRKSNVVCPRTFFFFTLLPRPRAMLLRSPSDCYITGGGVKVRNERKRDR